MSRVRASSPAPVVPSRDCVSGSPPNFGDGVVLVGLLSTLSNNAKAIVGEVFKAVGTGLDEFHFAMEAFGDAIVFGKAPHGRQRFSPARERLSQSEHGGEATDFELINESEEFLSQRAAGTLCLVLNIEESAEPMHGVIERLESRIFGKEPLEAQAVSSRELVFSLTQGRQRAAVVLDWRGNLAS